MHAPQLVAQPGAPSVTQRYEPHATGVCAGHAAPVPSHTDVAENDVPSALHALAAHTVPAA